MLLQLESTHKHRNTVKGRKTPISNQAVQLGRTKDVTDMIGDLDNS